MNMNVVVFVCLLAIMKAAVQNTGGSGGSTGRFVDLSSFGVEAFESCVVRPSVDSRIISSFAKMNMNNNNNVLNRYSSSRPSPLIRPYAGIANVGARLTGIEIKPFSWKALFGSAIDQQDSSVTNNTKMDGEEEEEEKKARALGILVLLTVPLSWGTYAPVVKYVYEMDPPVPGILFSAAYYIIASITLVALSFMQHQQIENSNENSSENSNQNSNFDDANSTKLQSLQGGLELGSYLFLGNSLQVIGLKTVPADRAAFLIQLTTVMVPLVQATLAGDILAVPLKTWAACLLAFAGVIVMGLNGDALLSISPTTILDTFSTGDILVVLAAFSYTMHVIRLGQYAKFTTPIRLAASKATTEAFLSLGLVFALLSLSQTSPIPAFAFDMGSEISTYLQSLSSPSSPAAILPAIGAVLWTGWVTCAYTIYAQSFGQRRVNPTDANLIYSTQPLFSALFAYLLVGETLGKMGFVGGALIAIALSLVASSDYAVTDENDFDNLNDFDNFDVQDNADFKFDDDDDDDDIQNGCRDDISKTMYIYEGDK